MKTKLQNILALVALGMGLVATTAPTWAGKVFTPEVRIQTDQMGVNAHGSMMGTRYSTDSMQNIGCTAYALESYSWTACFATDKVGNTLVCGSGDPRWAEVVQSMTDSSLITFRTTRNYGDCSDITLYDSSEHLK